MNPTSPTVNLEIKIGRKKDLICARLVSVDNDAKFDKLTDGKYAFGRHYPLPLCHWKEGETNPAEIKCFNLNAHLSTEIRRSLLDIGPSRKTIHIEGIPDTLHVAEYGNLKAFTDICYRVFIPESGVIPDDLPYGVIDRHKLIGDDLDAWSVRALCGFLLPLSEICLVRVAENPEEGGKGLIATAFEIRHGELYETDAFVACSVIDNEDYGHTRHFAANGDLITISDDINENAKAEIKDKWNEGSEFLLPYRSVL